MLWPKISLIINIKFDCIGETYVLATKIKLPLGKTLKWILLFFDLQSSLSHSNSEVGGTSSSGFAIPLAFSNIFQKKNNPEKPSEKASAIAKKPANTLVNGGKVR